MLTRSYGDVYGRFKDGTSIMLMPGEKPRTPYKFPPDHTCPKCGKFCWSRVSKDEFSCFWCGTFIIAEPATEFRRDSTPLHSGRVKQGAYEREARTVVCPDCGETFVTKSYSPLVRCEECRYQRKLESGRKKK